MTFREQARAEAQKRWATDALGFNLARYAFIRGAEWANEREPTDAQVKAAAETLRELGSGGYLATPEQHLEVARAALLAAKEAR